jgi:hypothetical protein
MLVASALPLLALWLLRRLLLLWAALLLARLRGGPLAQGPVAAPVADKDLCAGLKVPGGLEEHTVPAQPAVMPTHHDR